MTAQAIPAPSLRVPPELDASDPGARLARMERQLVAVRRTALLAWGIVLYLDGGFRSLDAPTVVYLCAVAYMELLHWRLRHARDMVMTTRVAAVGDSILAFAMCLMHGGASSVFIPHFYLTIMAAAFRFGSRESSSILILNFVLFGILALHDFLGGQTPKGALFVVQYMLVAFTLGKMLSSWATANLRIATDHGRALEMERDRSNLLLRRLIDAQEEERKALAEDLHDRMGESLFSIGHGLDASIAENADPSLAQRLVDLRRRLAVCTSYVRSFLNELRPSVLDELGLCEALSEYAASLKEITPFEIELVLDPALKSWKSRQDAMLFRLIQEVILNCRKHANATRLTVTLEAAAGATILTIEDDGVGFVVDHIQSGHFGLSMMRERAAVCGGKLAIDSAPGRGTKVIVVFGSPRSSRK
jgi:two-component system NarL family sensor kinase